MYTLLIAVCMHYTINSSQLHISVLIWGSIDSHDFVLFMCFVIYRANGLGICDLVCALPHYECTGGDALV